MEEAIELLEAEIMAIYRIVHRLFMDGLDGRAEHRLGEIKRLRRVIDLLEGETSWKKQ